MGMIQSRTEDWAPTIGLIRVTVEAKIKQARERAQLAQDRRRVLSLPGPTDPVRLLLRATVEKLEERAQRVLADRSPDPYGRSWT
jgi:hypothetical protein